MRRRRLSIISLLAFTALNTAAYGQVSSVVLPFMEIDHSPVTSALAGASLIRSCDGSDVSASYQMWKPSTTSYFSAAADVAIGKCLRVKADAIYGSSPAIQLISAPGEDARSFTPSDMMFGAGMSYLFKERYSVALKVKYASSRIEETNTLGTVAADLLFKTGFGGFSVAAGAVNLGPKAGGCAIASAAALAVSYDNGSDAIHRIRPEIDGKYYFCGVPAVSAGLDYCFKNIVSVRAGYHFGGLIANHASVGLGFNIRGFHLDASWLVSKSTLGNTLCFGMGYSF